MNRLLLICPSRARIDLMRQMLESVRATAEKVDVSCVVDDDDDVMGYQKLIAEYPFAFLTPNHVRCGGFIGLYNLVFRRYPHYQFYSPTNDDFVYLTPGWDQMLMQEVEFKFAGRGWAYGDDLHNGAKLPTTWVVGGRICRILGWLQVPWLKRSFGDNAILKLGTATHRIAYVPGVQIEHRHPSLGKNAMDATYRRGRGACLFYRDKLAYWFWTRFVMPNEIGKLECP